MGIAIFVVGDRDWAAPIALAGNQPVAHAIGDFGCAVEVAVDELGFHDWKIEFFGEFAVAVVVGGNCHDGASAVTSQDVVGHINWNFFFGGWVDGIGASKDTGFFFVFLTFNFGFFEGGGFVGEDGFAGVVIYKIIKAGVFGSNDQEGGAQNRVGAGGKDFNEAMRKFI